MLKNLTLLKGQKERTGLCLAEISYLAERQIRTHLGFTLLKNHTLLKGHNDDTFGLNLAEKVYAKMSTFDPYLAVKPYPSRNG